MTPRRAHDSVHGSRRRREGYKAEPRLTGDQMPREQVDALLSKLAYNPVTGCLTWTGCLNEKGYPVVVWRGKKYRVHILMWEWINARPVPQGHEIDHTCNCRDCCIHLEAVTHAENLRRIHAREVPSLMTWREARDARARDAHLDAIRSEAG